MFDVQFSFKEISKEIRKEGAVEIAKKLLKRGLSIMDVAEDTGLDESTIRQLQSELTA